MGERDVVLYRYVLDAQGFSPKEIEARIAEKEAEKPDAFAGLVAMIPFEDQQIILTNLGRPDLLENFD